MSGSPSAGAFGHCAGLQPTLWFLGELVATREAKAEDEAQQATQATETTTKTTKTTKTNRQAQATRKRVVS